MAATQEQMKMAEELLFSGKKRSNFAKLLYFGLFDSERVFPYPEVDEQEKRRVDELVAKVKDFAERRIDPSAIDKNADIPDSVICGLSEMGVMGMTIPAQYGGSDYSQYGYCRVIETLARRCSSTALLVSVHQSIGLKALLLFGTPQQREKWLGVLARGEKIAAFSLTEPEAGSDAANVQTRAVYDPQRKIYRITGQKQWSTNASIAGVLTVMARTELDTPEGKKDKITAFLVTPDMPGFKITHPALEKVGMRGTRTTNMAFENMEVPAENILGPPGAGLKVALTVLDYGRTTFGASCTGVAKECLELATAHAKTRHQFARPLASFALVKKKIATMAAYTYAMEAVTYLTAGMIDHKEEDLMLETAIVKVFASEALWQIIYDAMQILGGRSFFTDAPYERMMRDARLNTIGEGSNEVLRAFIGAVGMRDVGMQLQGIAAELRKHPLTGAALGLGFGRRMMAKLLSVPNVPVRSAELREEAENLGAATKRFGVSILRLLARYREEIVEKQMALDRIATAAISLYTAAAVLSKLDTALGRGQSAGNDLAVGRLYCKLALKSFDDALDSLFDNDDDQVEALSDRLTGIGQEGQKK